MLAQHTCHVAAICLGLLAVPPAAQAQDVVATSLDQLRMLARLGDTVTVTDASGHEITGKVGDLSATSLGLAGNSQSFAEREIRTIKRHDHANLATGAKWGFGVGAGTALALVAAFSRQSCNGCGGYIALGTLVYGGLGAGIGVGISAMIPTRRLIYVQPHSSAARLTLSPLLTRESKGISMSLGF